MKKKKTKTTQKRQNSVQFALKKKPLNYFGVCVVFYFCFFFSNARVQFWGVFSRPKIVLEALFCFLFSFCFLKCESAILGVLSFFHFLFFSFFELPGLPERLIDRMRRHCPGCAPVRPAPEDLPSALGRWRPRGLLATACRPR